MEKGQFIEVPPWRDDVYGCVAMWLCGSVGRSSVDQGHASLQYANAINLLLVCQT